MLSLWLSASLGSPESLILAPGVVQISQETRLTPMSVHLVRLDEADIRERMRQLPDWTTDGEYLFYTRTFDGFVEAVAFVNSLVEPAEQLGHHPDITISYNQVLIELTTHDAQGLTELDFQLAAQISQL
ncbi:MAG: 4a-hydroxytetrahydrobiopterin dehydratase [Cyanobacteria bacterium P01_H01_bin.26]